MTSSDKATAQIGVTGLAVMGSNIARNFARHGYTVALHNRSIAKTDALLAEHDIDGGLIGGASLEAKSFVDLVQSAAKSLTR